MFYIMSALVCFVKEDAPLFIICIGMYMFFEYKGEFKRIHGIIVSLLSGIYMISILNYLTEHGDGQSMSSSRFGHLMIDSTGGMSEVVKNSLSDPAYLISMLFNESTIQYLLAVMLPLLFVPLFTKKIHRYLLMMPFIITNLVIGFFYSGDDAHLSCHSKHFRNGRIQKTAASYTHGCSLYHHDFRNTNQIRLLYQQL